MEVSELQTFKFLNSVSNKMLMFSKFYIYDLHKCMSRINFVLKQDLDEIVKGKHFKPPLVIELGEDKKVVIKEGTS